MGKTAAKGKAGLLSERRGSTASCSSLVSMSAKPRWRNTWQRDGCHHRKAGRPFFTSRRGHRVDGHVRGADDFVSAFLWTSHPATFAARASVAGVTAHSDAEWIARQLTEACGWNEPPRYIIRDRNRAWRCIHPAPRSDGHPRSTELGSVAPAKRNTERLIGSIRRECLDQFVVFGERHLRHLLKSYQNYYNEVRPHLSLQKDAPARRHVCRTGCVRSIPVLGGRQSSRIDRHTSLRSPRCARSPAPTTSSTVSVPSFERIHLRTDRFLSGGPDLELLDLIAIVDARVRLKAITHK